MAGGYEDRVDIGCHRVEVGNSTRDLELIVGVKVKDSGGWRGGGEVGGVG